jgi:hypothetical protein
MDAATHDHPVGRGTFWQCAQKWLDRFVNDTRTIGRPHRGHGSPVRP